MPYLKDIAWFQQSRSTVFAKVFAPGSCVPVAGIYHCKSCGFETVAAAGTSLPVTERCKDHEARWKSGDGKVIWQLAAAVINANG